MTDYTTLDKFKIIKSTFVESELPPLIEEWLNEIEEALWAYEDLRNS